MHIIYLINIPLAHVAVKLVGSFEHCEEREGACQDENIGARDNETAGQGRILTLIHARHPGNIPLAHVAVKLFGVVKHCEEGEGVCQD